MKLLALTRYDKAGPSSRVRFYKFLPLLRKAGFSVEVKPLLDEMYVRRLFSNGKRSISELLQGYFRRCSLLLKAEQYDLIWIQKELFPWLPWIDGRFLKKINKPYVVDFDDAVYHLYDLHRYKLVRTLLGKKIDNLMRGATTVTVGNKYLAERAARAGAGRVEILPSVVDTERYQMLKTNNAKFTVGWIGTPITEKNLNEVRSPLGHFTNADDASKIVLVGASQNALDGISRRIVQWTEETEVQSIQSFDVGIMPLFDNPFERGKCGYKIIQCMACGVPVVASPVGVNREIVNHGEDGFLAETESEWLHYLNILKDDEQMRYRMGQKARAKVENEFSLSRVGPMFAKVLLKALQ